MKCAFIDVCNTLADINGVVKDMGLDPSGHALCADLSIWYDENTYRAAKPWLPSLHKVHKLKEDGYTLFYLTARPFTMINVTQEWIRMHGLPEAPVLCSSGYDKGDMIERFVRRVPGVTEILLIDDSPREIESFKIFQSIAKIPTKLIIPRHSYNQQYECDEEIDLGSCY